MEEKEREIELIVTGQVEGHMCAEDVWKFGEFV